MAGWRPSGKSNRLGVWSDEDGGRCRRALMTGTVDMHWAVDGVGACILENRRVRCTVLPEVGAKIYQLIHKGADRDLLYHHPRVELRTPVFGANVDNWWTGGIDDAVPTGHACLVDGEELPFLGEVWSLPWACEQVTSDSVRFTRQGVITPFVIEKTLELRPEEPFVRMHHCIRNVGMMPLQLIWGIHPGMPIGPATRIQVPARRGAIEEFGPTARDGDAKGVEYQWPRRSITEFGEKASGTWDLHYATGLEAGWLAVWDGAWGTGFGMTFPLDVFDCVTVWVVDGGWRGIRCVAVEPWAGYPARLDEAIAAGHARTIEPGGELSADTRLIAFNTTSPIDGFTEDGRPIVRSQGARI